MTSDAQKAARFSPPKWRPGGMRDGKCTPDHLSKFVDARAPLDAQGLAHYLRDCGAVPGGPPVTAKKLSDTLQRPLLEILSVLHAMRDAGLVTYCETGWLLTC